MHLCGECGLCCHRATGMAARAAAAKEQVAGPPSVNMLSLHGGQASYCLSWRVGCNLSA